MCDNGADARALTTAGTIFVGRWSAQASGDYATGSNHVLPTGRRARITAVDWGILAPEEATRLRALGIDKGAEVEITHRGVFAGKDPIAVTLGRMTIALRRAHAQAIEVQWL